MTKKLEELFELPASVKIEAPSSMIQEEAVTPDTLSNLEKIEQALPQVRGLEASDSEMDELADLAKNSYKDLMELGMQVDSRFSAEIFNSAGSMLNHAITAKTAKMNKKIKMIELQLKKAALDQKIESNTKEIEATPLGDGQALDRNELLRILTTKKDEK